MGSSLALSFTQLERSNNYTRTLNEWFSVSTQYLKHYKFQTVGCVCMQRNLFLPKIFFKRTENKRFQELLRAMTFCS